MFYLSIGVLQEKLTLDKCMVKCGSRSVVLIGQSLKMWLNGRFGIAECDTEDDELLKDLYKKGLVIVSDENDYDSKYNMFYRCIVSSAKSPLKVILTEDERTVYQWLRFSPLILDIADVLSLYERNLKVESKYIGKSNSQALIKLIFEPHDYHKDQRFLDKMFYSEKRDALVDIFLSLLSNGRLILLGRKDSYG